MRGHVPAIRLAPEPLLLSAADDALLRLLQVVAADGYRFTTPAPNTHRRIRLRRRLARAADLQDVLGWNLPFRPAGLPPQADGMSV